MEEEKKCNCKPGECSCGDDCNCDENCACGCNNPLIIEMEDDNGEKVKVEIVGTFDDNGKSYAVVNDLDDENNSYILEVQSTEEGDVLVSVDDEEEFDRLVGVVQKLLQENTEE
ncbi:MAG: DUF1292 domain-containing protein [Bacilli bacterium]|nr:DUF1292 domain-containing protein [Bacilli bacterium]MBO6195561.1 DUF1292 domain-containing protein [Bacilli bacterium]